MEEACKTGIIKLVKKAIKNYGNRDSVFYACRYGHFDLVKYLTSINSPIDIYAIKIASCYGNLDIVKHLMSINAPIDVGAIWYALQYEHTHIVKYLLWAGAPCDIWLDKYNKELRLEFEPVVSEFIGPDIAGLILQFLIKAELKFNLG